MSHSLAPADYLIVVGYFLVMLGIGVFFSRRMKSMKDFFGGNQQVPWWVSGVSLYMTSFSAFAFVAYSALAYQHGMVSITIWWAVVPCCLVSAQFFAARWRRAAATSPLEYVETRYGPFLRQGFAWLGVPLLVIDDALKLFVIGKMVTVSLGVTAPFAFPLAIVICGSIMLAYTFMGGLWAAMITDFVQFVVMAGAVMVLVPLALARVGGIGAFFQQAPEGFWAPTGGEYTWAWIIPFIFVQVFAYSTKWSYVQRYYSVKTDADARKVGYLVAALTFVGMPLLFLPAMAARIFMPGVSEPNDVYVLLCKSLFPVGMIGMMVAAMFSATMSTLSGDYNAMASVITNDIYKRLFARVSSERSLVLAGRMATLVVGLAALGIALLLVAGQGKEDLVEYMARLFSVLMPPVAIPMMFGLLTRRVSNAGGVAGFLIGAGFGITAYFLSYCEGLGFLRTMPFLPWITSVPTLVGLGLFSVLIPDAPEHGERIARFLDGLSRPEAAPSSSATDTSVAPAAIRIIGLASAAMGVVLVVAVLATEPFSRCKLSVGVGVAMVLIGLGVRRIAGTIRVPEGSSGGLS